MARTDSPTVARELVLLVNDIPDHATSYVAALNKVGYRVHHATSGEDALTAVAASRPDCAVIDLRLPDMSGWDLCRRLRARKECSTLRIIVLTPDVSRMSATESSKVGCHAWLTHPTVADDLVRTVREVMSLERDAPSETEEAILRSAPCPACGSELTRPTLRVSAIQYYCCRQCRFCWRVEVLTASRA